MQKRISRVSVSVGQAGLACGGSLSSKYKGILLFFSAPSSFARGGARVHILNVTHSAVGRGGHATSSNAAAVAASSMDM